MRIELVANEATRRALESIGRTEDVKFSPDDSRLAIAAYRRNSCLLLDVRVGPGPALALTGHVELTSPCLREPHGVAFVDDRTLAVANRAGLVHLFALPPSPTAEDRISVDPLCTVGGGLFRRVRSPGSVAVRQIGRHIELLVCNNFVHRVTRHRLDPDRKYRRIRNGVLLARGLEIPDGIDVSRDGRWIAVSSHGTHAVRVYEDTPVLGRRTPPAATLEGPNYPHGVRFTADDAHLVVADAGSPFVHVYARPHGGWCSSDGPLTSVQVLGMENYLLGRENPMEGGPKGLDMDHGERLLVTTCERSPLDVFDLSSILASRHPVPKDWSPD